MAERYALAFSAAALLTLAATAGLRWLAGRIRGRRLRTAGGIALAAGTLIGSAAVPSLPLRVAVLALGASALVTFGIVDAYRFLPAWARLATVTVAALAAAVADVRAAPTGDAVFNVLVTTLWVVLLALAMRGVDETDGLAAALTVAVCAGVFALAGFGEQFVAATLAAALAGACCGFLAYNIRPASVFLSDAGALFLGFMLGALTVEVRPAISPPGSFALPLLLVAVPLLDLALVAAGRMRRSGRYANDGRDHLAHRLIARGLGPMPALLALAAVQLALAAIAVFTGRAVLSIGWGVALGAMVVAALALVTVTAPVYGEAPVGLTGRAKLIVVGLFLAAGAALAPAAVAAVSARGLMNDGRDAVEAALAAARDGDDALAAAKFGEAGNAFGDAHDLLAAPWSVPGLAVPFLGPNLAAARDLAEAGTELAEAGLQLTAEVDPARLEVVNGTVPLAEVERLSPDLEAGARSLREVTDDLAGINSPFLLPPVRDAIDRLDSELADARRESTRVAAAARLAPAILGGEGTRRYFLAVQNSAELRATGGFIGNWGILVAEEGDVRLEQFDRVRVLNARAAPDRQISAPAEYVRRYGRFDPANTWQNVNMSPDFPTVGGVIADLYPQSGGEPIDGVLAVDPVGLAALLELTGPVTVEGWPEPLTATNVIDVTLRDAYAAFENSEREDFLGDVAETVVDDATEGALGEPARIARVLGQAAHEGHLILSFVRPEEQRLARILDVAGQVPPVHSDSLMVTTQNAAGNKLDYYLERELDYGVVLTPVAHGREVDVTGTLAINLGNTAPPSGLPAAVAGPYDPRFVAGENRSFVSVYTPHTFDTATLDGEATGLETGTELRRNVFSSFVSIFAASSRTLALDLAGTARIDPDGWYTLDLVRQPMLLPERVTISLAVAEGWHVSDAIGLEIEGRRASGAVRLTDTTTVGVRLERDDDRTLWQRLDADP